MSIELTRELCNECFEYFPDTGHLFWRYRPLNHFTDLRSMRTWNTRFAERLASYDCVSGQQQISINGYTNYVHVIAWILINGCIPLGEEIDHVDGDARNNRISNLRSVAHQTNQKNCKRSVKNTSGATGIAMVGNKFRVRISHTHIGMFDTFEDALACRIKIAKEIGYTERCNSIDNHTREKFLGF